MGSIKIITFSGPSAVGKSAIVGELLRRNSSWRLVVNITTRGPKDSDIPGEYRHVSEDEFVKLEQEGKFLETDQAHGNRYGTLLASLDEALSSGPMSLQILTPDGVPRVMDHAKGKVLSFFVFVRSVDVLRKRLKARGESEKSIEQRLSDCARWHEEAKASGLPYVFIDNSGTVEETVQKVLGNIPIVK